jgi:hypothetical protein
MIRTHLCCLVIATVGGCVDRPVDSGTIPTTAAPITFDRGPEVLLSSRKPDKLIVATVRLLALSVPNRDDYARGDFRNMDELALFDTDHAAARDASKTPAERAGKVEWRAGLGN